jgi:hypothetical protein
MEDGRKGYVMGTNKKIEEMRAVVDAFLANVSDEDFWAFLDAADMGVYGDATIPRLEMLGSEVCSTTFCTVPDYFSETLDQVEDATIQDLSWMNASMINLECGVAMAA